jgi:hypothetical protein
MGGRLPSERVGVFDRNTHPDFHAPIWIAVWVLIWLLVALIIVTPFLYLLRDIKRRRRAEGDRRGAQKLEERV